MNISLSRWFLLWLWWRELFWLGACLGFFSLGATWLILRRVRSRTNNELRGGTAASEVR
jgi:hypothetical protein